MRYYYNEFDPYAADWLENLIRDGLLPAGDVDRRNLWDVAPDDLIGYDQHHLCAGIGGWPLAIMRAGYAEQRGIFSVSAPCQPYSAAGQGLGFADERHLWPACYHHIGHLRPRVVLGEQVSSKLALEWWRLVSDDLQAAGYVPAAIDTSVASIGGPHIRQRLYWMAHTDSGLAGDGNVQCGGQQRLEPSDGAAGGLAHAAPSGRGEECALGSGQRVGDGTQGRSAGYVDGGEPVRLGDAFGSGLEGYAGYGDDRGQPGRNPAVTSRYVTAPGDGSERPNPLHGPWRDADWLFCTDGKWRPIEPGATALAHGLPRGMGTLSAGVEQLVDLAGCDASGLRDAKRYRVGSLKGYGNAICVEQAEGFVRAAMGII